MDLRNRCLPVLEIVKQFLTEENWQYQMLEKRPALRIGYHGEHGTWVCYAQVDEQAQRLLFYSWMGMNIPILYRAAVIEYLTRVNFALTLGNFEMDLQNGEVRFRTSLDCAEGLPGKNALRTCLYANVRCMDHYFPGVLAVVHSGISPQAAMARVERQITEA